tara:strand:+ start:1379 stop:2557 length:1179 start_codon:yes stop_codon:yes gene_type:complete
MLNEFKFLTNKLPHHVIFYPTSRCNLFCEHCFNHKRQDNVDGNTGINSEMSLEEIDKFSSSFEHIKSLTITGGEPFLRKDIKEIIEIFYKNNGLQYCSIHSHGLLNERVVSTVKKIMEDLPELKVIYCTSIDGLEERHNQIRGAKDGFNKCIKTVNDIQAIKNEYFERLFLLSCTIFSFSSQNEYIKTIKYINQNLKYVSPRACFIRGEPRDEKEKNIDTGIYKDFIKITSKNIDKTVSPFSAMALKETIESVTSRTVMKNYLEKKQTVPCQAGNKMVVIYENGDVNPCEYLTPKERLGNLRDAGYDIKKILGSDHSKCVVKDINPGKKCSCTWENAIGISLMYDKKSWPRIFMEWFNMFFLKRFILGWPNSLLNWFKNFFNKKTHSEVKIK